MKIALCATKQTIASIWSDALEQTDFVSQIIFDEKELLDYLLENKEESLVLLEDIWDNKSEKEVLELVTALRSWYPYVDIMVLSQLPTFSMGREFLSLGVKGYGNARMLPIHLKDAIVCIHRGDVWMYPEFIQTMIKNINVNSPKPFTKDILKKLTTREKEISKLVYAGYTNKEISDELDISLRTVKAHTTSIYDKLEVKDRVALVLMLKDLGA